MPEPDVQRRALERRLSEQRRQLAHLESNLRGAWQLIGRKHVTIQALEAENARLLAALHTIAALRAEARQLADEIWR